MPAVRNVVFFKYVSSAISFYQMVDAARASRATGKLMFRVYDYTNATRLFGEQFRSRAATVTEAGAGPAIEGDEEGEDGVRVIAVEGLIAKIVDGGRFVLMNQDGRDLRMPIQECRGRSPRPS